MHDSHYKTRYGSVDRLKIATINIPNEYFQYIEDLVDLGFYPSRSDCYRQIISLFLKKLKNTTNQFANFHEIKQSQMEKMLQ